MGKTLAAVCALLAVAYIAFSLRIPVPSIDDPVGPRTFPLMIGGTMAIIAVLLWLEARSVASASEPKAAPDPALKRRQRFSAIGVSAATLLYALTMETVGYPLVTFLLMLGMLIVFNGGKRLINVVIAAGTTAVFYLGFKYILGVPLPGGIAL